MNGSNLDFYKTWAPAYAEWTAWAKPVLFACMAFTGSIVLDIPEVPVESDSKTMIIIDLPGELGVAEALAYAAKGWRPVPLYNGVLGEGKMSVDVRSLGDALRTGAGLLRSMSIPLDAPPVFMLDSERMYGSKTPGEYDNRWCVFPQDMPSAEYIISKGINKVIVRSARWVRVDLERVLYDYQKNGIALLSLQSNDGPPKELVARKLSFAEELAYRFRATFKLTRNATGGFGGLILEPHERNSGMRFYRMG